MSYDQFIMAHPELDSEDRATKEIAYQDYLDSLDDAFSLMEE